MRVFFFIAGCVVAKSVVGCSNNNANPGAPTATGGTTGGAQYSWRNGCAIASPVDPVVVLTEREYFDTRYRLFADS